MLTKDATSAQIIDLAPHHTRFIERPQHLALEQCAVAKDALHSWVLLQGNAHALGHIFEQCHHAARRLAYGNRSTIERHIGRVH